MRLTVDEIDLLRTSVRRLTQQAEHSALAFYDHLFELAPDLRPLFGGDIDKQTVKMMSTLGSIVAQLHDQDTLQSLVRDLGQRHVGYGAQPEHYALLGETLLWTLEQELGPDFTPEMAAAWQKGFDGLAAAMIAAAEDPAAVAGRSARPKPRRRAPSRRSP